MFVKGQSGNPAGPKARVLSVEELATITTLCQRGVRPQDLHRAVLVSRQLFAELRQRQPEVLEAIDAGMQRFHDALVQNIVHIAADEGNDARTRLDALRFLLASRFNYRDRGEPQINVGVGIDVGSVGPQLTVVCEQLAPAAQQALLAALQSDADDPMALDGDQADEATGARAPGVVRSPRRRLHPHPAIRSATESEVALAHAWDGSEPPAPNPTVHIRDDAQPISADAASELSRG